MKIKLNWEGAGIFNLSLKSGRCPQKELKYKIGINWELG